MTSLVPVLNANLHYEFHLTVMLAARNADSRCREGKLLELAEIFSKICTGFTSQEKGIKNCN